MKQTLTFAVMNLQSGIGTTKGYWQYITTGWKYLLPGTHDYILAAADTLAKEKVDIALLTEVNEISFRHGNKSQIKTLKSFLAPADVEFFPTIKSGKHIHEGNAVISKYPIIGSNAHPLPRFTIPRFLGETTIEIGDTTVLVCVVHLSLNLKRRQRQLQAVAEILKTKTGPMVLGGDFNEKDVATLEPLFSVGFKSVCAINNYPSWKPTHTLDYLFLSGHFSAVYSYTSLGNLFSDHAPLFVQTTLTPS